MGQRVRFGPFELDRQTGELWKHGLRVRLQGKPFQVLTALLERPGEPVSREELQQRLWSGDDFIDFESGLNTAANRLRIALGDSVEHPRYVETLARSGYRFVASVEDIPVQETPAQAPEPPPVVRKSRWLIPAICLIAVVAAAVLWLALRPAQTTAKFQQITFKRGMLGGARFAPDGQSIVYSAKWDGQPWKVFLTSTASPETRTLGYDGYVLNSVSSTGELLLRASSQLAGTTTAASLSRVPMNEGAPLTIASQAVCSDWSPDGKQVAVVRNDGLQSSIEYPIGRVLYKTTNQVRCIRVSRDGKEILFTEHRRRGDEGGDVRVVEVNGHVRTLSSGWTTLGGLSWSADSSEAWFTATRDGVTRSLWAVNRSGRLRLVARAPGSLVIEDISRDGRVLITRQDRRMEMAAHVEGEPADRDLSWFDHTEARSLSPDGRFVLFNETGDAGGPNGAIYLHRMADDATLRLGEGQALSISPDGRWAVALHPADRKSLTLLPSGPGASKSISGAGLEYKSAQFFPDGQRLLVAGVEPGHNPRLYLQKITDGKPVPLLPELFLRNMAISADGTWVAGTDQDLSLTLVRVENGERRQIRTSIPVQPLAWISGDRALLVRDIAQVPVHTLKMDLRTGRMEAWKTIGASGPGSVGSIDSLLVTSDLKSYVFSFSPELGQLYLADGWK